MQRVYCVCISGDSKMALCGSEDMNVRLFKMKANEELRVVSGKQRQSINYQEKLLKKWKDAPEVKSIAEKQNLPKKLHTKKKQRSIMMAAHFRKEMNRINHSKTEEYVPLRKKRIVEDQT